jgi:hypothetical protein
MVMHANRQIHTARAGATFAHITTELIAQTNKKLKLWGVYFADIYQAIFRLRRR